MAKWEIKGTTLQNSGHGQSDELLIISHPDIRCNILLTDPYMNDGKKYQLKLAEALIKVLNYKNDQKIS
jgi:hypothetical protein